MHKFKSALRTKQVPQPAKVESLPLKRGEVVYLGYRPELEACVYAMRDERGRPPYPLGLLLAKALDVPACSATEDEVPQTRQDYYARMAEYYGERATEAMARYLETGQRIDRFWGAHFTRVSLRYAARAGHKETGRYPRG